jgi:hypothetical protein
MKWFWQRRKKEAPATNVPTKEPQPERLNRATQPRAPKRSTPLAITAEPRGELLAFARDLLSAQGLRVRVEEDDLVTASGSDGATARYTTTIARARAEEEITLLTQGAPALSAFFDVAAQRARRSSVTLTRPDDPESLVLRALRFPAEACGRCASGAKDGLPIAPSCEVCPLRHGALALRWESRPATPHVTGWEDAQSVEFAYCISGRDRRRRRDEWLRLAFDANSGARVRPITLPQLGAATSESPESSAPNIRPASASVRKRLRPGMEALSAYLAQRAGAEYQRRVEDVTATHERLKRERPDETVMIAAALDRELASLAGDYSVEVEASLAAICFVTSPIARIQVPTADGGELSLTFDAGREDVHAPVCAICGDVTTAGRVCVHGHLSCANCVEACAHCDALRCPLCDPKPFARCGTCHEWTCDGCARACDDCSVRHCAEHVWVCVAGDHTLCLTHVTPCDECQAPLCQTHVATCAECGKALCPDHTCECVTGNESLCAVHATSCATCHQPLCAAHTLNCDECGQAICQQDHFICLGCGRDLCGCSHPEPCEVCGASYCARCYEGGATCPACRNLTPARDDDLQPLRLASERDATINLKRAWLAGSNALSRIYVSRGLGREEVYVVSNKGEVIAMHRKGWRV